MQVFQLGSRGCIEVNDDETVCNVVAASEAAIKEIALKARKIISQNSFQIEAVINEAIYHKLCRKHGIGNGFSL